MNRLTKTYTDGSFGVADKLPCGENSVAFKKLLLDTLGAYENDEEQGLLVRLPSKVGDTMYTNVQFQGSYLREKDKPYAVKVVFVGLNRDISTGGGFINVVYSTEHMLQFNFSDIGKTVFLTKEDAEKALAERSVQNE